MQWNLYFPSCAAKTASLCFHLGEHDKCTDLILSAEGNADLMPLLQKVEQSALLPEGWRVLAAYDGDFVIGRRNLSVFPETENRHVRVRVSAKRRPSLAA